MSYQGPCLLHCYKQNSLIILIIGILIGIIISEWSKTLYIKSKHSKSDTY